MTEYDSSDNDASGNYQHDASWNHTDSSNNSHNNDHNCEDECGPRDGRDGRDGRNACGNGKPGPKGCDGERGLLDTAALPARPGLWEKLENKDPLVRLDQKAKPGNKDPLCIWCSRILHRNGRREFRWRIQKSNKMRYCGEQRVVIQRIIQ